MKNRLPVATLAMILCSSNLAVHAASWGDSLRQQASPLGSSSPEGGAGSSALARLPGGGAASTLSSFGVPAAGTASNAAGVITYCLKNNYIQANKAKAEQVRDQLLGNMGLSSKKKEEPKDPGYLGGLAGKITGSNGQSFSMDQLKGNMREKACDFVLDNATRFL